MSFSQSRNRHDGAGSEDGRVERLLQRCSAYVVNPYAARLPDGLLPSDMIRPLLDTAPLSQHESILGNVIYYRVVALEPQHSGKITAMILDQLSTDQILNILDNDPVFRIRVQEAKAVYEAHLRRQRDEVALVEEAPFAPPTTPDRPQSYRDASTQARAQPQTHMLNQNTTQIQTRQSPRRDDAPVKNATSTVHGEAQNTTGANGVTVRPPLSQTQFQALPQTQYRPQPRARPQPRQNAAVNADNHIPRRAARRARQPRLQFVFRNGWLICRNVETHTVLALHVSTILVMFAIILLLNRRQWQLWRILLCIILLFLLQHVAEGRG